MPKFTKTVRAFLNEEGSLWAIVDALTEEMPGDCSASALGECQQYLAEAGIEKTTSAIREYRITGRFVEYATPEQAKLFRSQSVWTINRFANHGASQEMAAAAIASYQQETGRQRMGADVVKALFGGPSGDSRPDASDPDEWSDAQWAVFDRKFVEATKTVLMGFNSIQRGLYKPSVEAAAQLALIRQQDLDAELAALLGNA